MRGVMIMIWRVDVCLVLLILLLLLLLLLRLVLLVGLLLLPFVCLHPLLSSWRLHAGGGI